MCETELQWCEGEEVTERLQGGIGERSCELYLLLG